MKNHCLRVFFVVAAVLLLNLPVSIAADFQDSKEEADLKSPEMKSRDHTRYNSRIEIHKPAVLPEGIIPARKPIKFPRNEKIRIAEPRIMKIADTVPERVEPITRIVPLAHKPAEKY